MKHDKPTEDAVSVTEERRQFDLPELLHNLDLLVEMAESEVIQNDKKWVLFNVNFEFYYEETGEPGTVRKHIWINNKYKCTVDQEL